MPSTIALVAALSSGHKIGLALVGVAFVVFALLSAMVVPRRYPDFPGRHVGWYVTVSVLFFVAMLAAVLVFGREKTEASGATGETTQQQTTTAAAPPTTTTSGATTTTSGGGAPQGDPVAGKAVFGSAGCSGCHTLKAAGATGTVGPNLDSLKPPYDKIVQQVENGGAIMPPFKGKLSDTQIHDVAAFVYTSTHS
jgi:mono/diheme cytochrome c family protein